VARGMWFRDLFFRERLKPVRMRPAHGTRLGRGGADVYVVAVEAFPLGGGRRCGRGRLDILFEFVARRPAHRTAVRWLRTTVHVSAYRAFPGNFGWFRHYYFPVHAAVLAPINPSQSIAVNFATGAPQIGQFPVGSPMIVLPHTSHT